MTFRSTIQLNTAAVICCLLLGNAALQLHAGEGDWPRYRGADGLGRTNATELPVKWTNDNVVWKTTIDGFGQSSPCVWGDQIFLTSAVSNASGSVDRLVICLDRNEGKIVWRQVASTGEGESIHKMNTWATPTCATDGKLVVAYFGSGGIHCYSLDGDKKWSVDLGDFAGAWGTSASPIIVGDTVIQNCDAEGPSRLVALDLETGKERWNTKRRSLPKGGWSTPFVIETKERPELILNGEFGVQSYNPATGEEYWFCQSFNGRGSPIPAWNGDTLFVLNGKPGDVYAVKPGGSGDVTDTHMAWHTQRGGDRDLPSPIVVGKNLFTISMKGIATLYETETGKEVWKKRLGGNYSATPIVANGLVYLVEESGDTVVVRAGADLEEVARNSIDVEDSEIFRGEIVPSNGQFLLRSNQTIYCIRK